MAQSSIHRYFNTRKRPADDNYTKLSKKVLVLEAELLQSSEADAITPNDRSKTRRAKHKLNFGEEDSPRTPSKQIIIDASTTVAPQSNAEGKAEALPKVVTFTQVGPLSPKKRLRSREPTKSILKGEVHKMGSSNDLNPGAAAPMAPRKKTVNELTMDEIKSKLTTTKSMKLTDLKASLLQLKQLESKRQELRKLNSMPTASTAKASPGKQLTPFDSIDLEIQSPHKEFKTPEKVTPAKSGRMAIDTPLMSPRQSATKPRKLLFSPAKADSATAVAEQLAATPPAYEKYKHLVAPRQTLELPFKYRGLIELFKCCDTVCAIFYNRKEKITLNKLRPAVQRMCLKNFTEHHLAQIKHILPEAYEFDQHKMRNFGSVSKEDYYQLVITPVLSKMEESVDVSGETLNSQRLLQRLDRFQAKMFDRAADEHDKFLAGLKPPMKVNRNKLTRWHPDWDIQACPEVPAAELPKPPNVDKFVSAQAVLSAARDLFNCATPIERAMAQLDERRTARQLTEGIPAGGNPMVTAATTITSSEQGDTALSNAEPKSQTVAQPPPAAIKGIPTALLEKIRAKQAAKALSIMTRRPSQEQDAIVHSRLPELARHVRNVFATEKKSCLKEEFVMGKIMNSFRVSLTVQMLNNHLQLLAKVSGGWMTYHDIRKERYIKLCRETDVAELMEKLRKLANEKCV